MQANLNSFDRFVRFLGGVFFLFAAAILFEHPVARILAGLFGCYSLWEGFSAQCPLFSRVGIDSKLKPAELPIFQFALTGTQLVLAYEWLMGGWQKIISGTFVDGLEKTFEFFASKNPYPWYKAFLLGFATDNAVWLGYVVEWGEFVIGVVLFLAGAIFLYAKSASAKRAALVASTAALLGGLLMNANFYLAAGWTGAGTKGSNVVMFWVEVVLLYTWISVIIQKQRSNSM